MPCECCQVKRSKKNGFFEPRRKCCKICHRIMCDSCIMRKICLFCTIKENTILERETLIKMSEEELVEIAEAFGVSLDSDKLLKSQLVQLVLITCKSSSSLKSPPGTPKMTPRKLSPYNIQGCTQINANPMQTSSTVTVTKPTQHSELPDLLLENSHEKRENTEMNSPPNKTEKRERRVPSIRHQNEEVQDHFEEKEEKEISKQGGATYAIPHNDMLGKPRKMNSGKNLHLIFSEKNLQEHITLSEIPTSDSIVKLSISQLKRILKDHSIEWRDLIEKWEFEYRVMHLWHDLKEKEGYKPEVLFENASLRVSTLSSRNSEFKMNCIKSKKRRGLYLSINTDKEIQQRNQSPGKSCIDLKEKEGYKPDVFLENTSLRKSDLSSPNSEFKMSCMKAKKRRGLYVFQNTENEKAQQQKQSPGESSSQGEFEEDFVSSKKKKLEYDRNLTEKPNPSLKIDVAHASLLPPMRSLSLEDVVSPESIKGLSMHPRTATNS